jgi:hypothetical protein
MAFGLFESRLERLQIQRGRRLFHRGRCGPLLLGDSLGGYGWRARCDDEKRIREAGILRIRELVQRLPGNEHRHDNHLARAGRHLESHPG